MKFVVDGQSMNPKEFKDFINTYVHYDAMDNAEDEEEKLKISQQGYFNTAIEAYKWLKKHENNAFDVQIVNEAVNSNSALMEMVKNHIDVNKKIDYLNENVSRIDSLLERHNAGESLSEEEIDELLGGLGAVGNWAGKKGKDFATKAADKGSQFINKTADAAKRVAGDIEHQYQKGQRAQSIDQQRRKVDKQQIANNEKVQQLAARGNNIKKQISNLQASLNQVSQEYEKLTGKKYAPNRAVANAKRYVDESENSKRVIKVTYDTGDTVTTSMASNLSDEEMKSYFKPGKKFNIGSGGQDKMATVVSNEIVK